VVEVEMRCRGVRDESRIGVRGGMPPVARKIQRWTREMGWDDVDGLILVGFGIERLKERVY
jgi:hypothetical protein